MLNHALFERVVLRSGDTSPIIYRQAIEQEDPGYVDVMVQPLWWTGNEDRPLQLLVGTVDPSYIPKGKEITVDIAEVMRDGTIRDIRRGVRGNKPSIVNVLLWCPSGPKIRVRVNLPGSQRGRLVFWNWYPRITVQAMAAMHGGGWTEEISFR